MSQHYLHVLFIDFNIVNRILYISLSWQHLSLATRSLSLQSWEILQSLTSCYNRVVVTLEQLVTLKGYEEGVSDLLGQLVTYKPDDMQSSTLAGYKIPMTTQ